MSNIVFNQNNNFSNQNENPIGYTKNPLKQSAGSLNYSFNNEFRVFGKELTNLTNIQDNLPKFQNLKQIQPKKMMLRSNAQKIKPIINEVRVNEKHDNSYISETDGFSTRRERNPQNDSSIQIRPFDGDITVRVATEESEQMAFDLGTLKDREEEPEMEACDIQDKAMPQAVAEYASIIFKDLRDNEEKFLAQSGYMIKQNDINEKMRAILIDWLVDVHLKFKLLPETLFLTVNIIDRYLEVAQVSRVKLQLIGVTAMLIACKYEEIYSPEINDFVYVTDKAYTREEILETEGKILAALKFNLTTPSSYRFFERYAKVHGIDERTSHLSRYLIELALIEYKMLKYIPSNIATSAIYLACKILKKEAWNEALQRNSQYSESQIRPCAKDLCVLLQNANRTSLQAVKRKFSSTKFMEISKIQLDKH